MDFNNKVLKIMSSSIFKKLACNDKITLLELNTAISLLIKCNLDFTLLFNSGTRADPANATLTIAINPTTDITFTIPFGTNGKTLP